MHRMLRPTSMAWLAVVGLVASLAGPARSADPVGRRARAGSAAGPIAPMAQVVPGKPITLTILHTNDVHAHVDEWVTGGITVGGVARLATAVRSIRASGENVLLLDAGDQFMGTLFYTVYKSEILTATMNALGYDAMVVGNHEFDAGPDELARFISGAHFPVLGANIEVTAEDSPLAGRLAATAVITMANEPVGLVGLTTDETPSLSSSGPDIEFGDPVSAARLAVAEFAERGIDKIVALTHLGYTNDMALARAVPQLDVIVGGHSHTLLRNPPDGAAGPYPTVVETASGERTLIVSAGEWGQYLGHLVVTFDGQGRVQRFGGNPIRLDSAVAKDPELEALVARYRAPLETYRRRVIGESTVDLPIREGQDQVCRVGECLIGNLVADAVRERAEFMDWEHTYVSILNGGSFRAALAAGPITLGDVMEVLPFGNTLATLAITGTYLVQALENGVGRYPEQSGRFPQVSGLRFEWHPDQPPGSRIAAVRVWDWDFERWLPLDPNAIYWVATNDFLRRGGDGYTVFRDFAIEPYDFGPPLDEVLIDYILEHSPIHPRLEGRIRRAHWQLFVPLALQSGEPAAHPPMTEDEYAVLRTTIQHQWPITSSLPSRFVIADHTAMPAMLFYDEDDPYEYLAQALPGLQRATYGDFVARNVTATRLEDRFGLHRPVVLIAEREIEEIFGTEPGGWDAFYERYPGAQGIMNVSRPGMSPDGRQALVYLGNQAHYLAGAGHMFLLARTSDGWRVAAGVMLWIS